MRPKGLDETPGGYPPLWSAYARPYTPTGMCYRL